MSSLQPFKNYAPSIDSLNSKEKLQNGLNVTTQQKLTLLSTPSGQGQQKGNQPTTPQYQNQNTNIGINMKCNKNLNSIGFQHQHNASNKSESLSELRNFFQDNQHFLSTNMNNHNNTNTNNNQHTNGINQNSSSQNSQQYCTNGQSQALTSQLHVTMTPSTAAEDKSVMSYNTNSNPKQQHVDSSSMAQQQHNHSKQVSQTAHTSGFNTSHEISQFNFSSIAPNSTPLQFGSSISSAIQNICLDDETNIAATLPTNHSLSLTCPQHPNKKVFIGNVKYQMSHDENERFCSTCAVEFARQGFAINEIVKAKAQIICYNSEKEMNEFMSEMMSVKKLNELLMSCFEDKLEYVRDQCMHQTQTLHDLFFQIEKSLYEHKTSLLSQINTKMWDAINAIEQKKNEAQIYEKRFLRNQQDIERNQHKIVSEMDVTEVRNILQYYHDELKITKSNINDIFNGTTFKLVTLNSPQNSHDLAVLHKLIHEDIFKPHLLTYYLSDQIPQLNIHNQNAPVNLQPATHSTPINTQNNPIHPKSLQINHIIPINNNIHSNQQKTHMHQNNNISPSKCEKVQLSRLMTNVEKKGSSKKTTKSMAAMNQMQLQQFDVNKTHIKGLQSKEQQVCVQQTQQRPQQQEVIDTSISEKQQTQESDDLSSVQGIYQNPQNNSKISNKSNISSHKIINYSDIHDEQSNIHMIKNQPSSSAISASKNIPNIRESKQTTLQQDKKQFLFQCVSPQMSKGEGIYRQFSTNKENNQWALQKQKQVVQTEPSHLPGTKYKQMGNKPGNHQRNLMMNEETTFGANNKFRLGQNPTNNLNLMSQQQNKNSKLPQQDIPISQKVFTASNVRQQQLNLVDDKSLSQRVNTIQNTSSQANTNINYNQNTANHIVAQLIQQKQHLNTMKNHQQQMFLHNNDYVSQPIKN